MTFSTILISSVSMFKMLSQFFVLPLLARFLTPEDYGLIALAVPFILFSVVFAHSGMGSSLLRDDERNHKIWSSCFWFVTLVGVGLTLFIVAISPIAAWFFQTPKLMPVLSIMSLSIFFQSLTIVPITSLRQQKKFGQLASISMVSITLGMITAVAVAVMGGGVWAIVLQGIVLNGSLTIFSFFKSDFRPQFKYDFSVIKEHLSFGYTVTGAVFIDFFKDTFRSFAIGKIFGTTLLGFYALAFLFLNLPFQILKIVFSSVIYTYLVSFRENKQLLREMFLLLTRVLFILVFPAMGMLAVAHEPVFHILLSEKWDLTGKLFMLAAPAAALNALSCVRIAFLQILGDVQKNVRCSIESLLLQIALFIGFVWYGLEAVVISMALAWALYYLRDTSILIEKLDCNWIAYLKTIFSPILATALGALCYVIIIRQFAITDELLQMGTAILIGVFVLMVSILFQLRRFRKDIVLMKELFDKKTLPQTL